MRVIWAIAAKDLRQRLRDRSAIVVGFVAPILIAGLMSLALHNVDRFHVRLVVVDRDHGAIATAFRGLLDSKPIRAIATVRDAASDADARHQLRTKHADAAIVIPAGFSRAATTDARGSLLVHTTVDQPLAGQVARSIANGFVAQVDADRLAVATALATRSPPSDTARLAALAARLRLPETTVTAPVGRHQLTAISYYGPGMAIFFVLFAVMFVSRSFFTERRNGTIARISAAPIRPAAILAGKALSVFLFGASSLFAMAVVTTVLFGARWGPAAPVALLCILMSLSVVALTAFVITSARTERQAEGLSSIIVFALALLGGNFVALSRESDLLRRISLLTPNGWALRGFTDLSTDAGAGSVVRPALAMTVFTIVVGTLAVTRARRTLVT